MYGTDGEWGKTWGGIITSVINSVQIQILNTVYKKVAVALTGEGSLVFPVLRHLPVSGTRNVYMWRPRSSIVGGGHRWC